MKKIIFITLIAITTLFTSCSNHVSNIPSGFTAKLLTPTGFSSGILEAGQVDLGEVASNGQSTSLVLLESTTITSKESFGQAGSNGNKDDKEDHRVMTKTSPLTVDIYVQLRVPKELKLRENAFASVTPVPYVSNGTTQDRVSVIYLEDVYERFAKMTIRGKVRGIFAKYKDYQDVMDNFDKVNAEIGLMANDVFKNANVPLDLIDIQLSNVKEDETIWASKNEKEASLNKVASIEAIGAAIKNNPGYIQIRKWEVLGEIIKSPNAANINLIVSDDNSKPVVTVPTTK